MHLISKRDRSPLEHYPVNMMRNIANQLVLTKWTFVIDSDIIPNARAQAYHEQLIEMHGAYLHEKEAAFNSRVRTSLNHIALLLDWAWTHEWSLLAKAHVSAVTLIRGVRCWSRHVCSSGAAGVSACTCSSRRVLSFRSRRTPQRMGCARPIAPSCA